MLKDFKDASGDLRSFVSVYEAQHRIVSGLRASCPSYLGVLCDEMGLSLPRLARRMGWSRQWLWRVSSGEKIMSAKSLYRLGRFVDEWIEKERRAEVADKRARRTQPASKDADNGHAGLR